MSELLAGLKVNYVDTKRLRTAILVDEREGGEPVIFVHGNVSSSLFWQESILALPEGFRGIAPDLRGFGESETAPVDATRGLGDFADDLYSLVDALDITKAHFVGWSMGGGIVMRLLGERPELVASLTLVSPVSPYGFGATKGTTGELATPDAAGAGGASANPDFVAALVAGDRGADAPTSPRNVLNGAYFANDFRSPLEETFLDSMLTTKVGDGNYPGDSTASDNWPGFAPGTRGVLNTMVPGVHDVSGIVNVSPKPPILWVHGSKDIIVSDASMFDLANLGKIDVIPGWPGDEACPPQPMVTQTRTVLDDYAAAGGSYREVELDCGHSAMVERPAEFQAALAQILRG
ncbi:MAG: alpha/beta hydrolase [Acidimicrobiales bacterium]|nr:alpha/beta hydrolase [Acidimicrobiales bacterium]